MSGSLRCSPCGVSWPEGGDYQPCPQCLGPTSHITDAPIDAADAWSKMTHARFDRWLDEHGRRDPVEKLERIPVKEEAA